MAVMSLSQLKSLLTKTLKKNVLRSFQSRKKKNQMMKLFQMSYVAVFAKSSFENQSKLHVVTAPTVENV